MGQVVRYFEKSNYADCRISGFGLTEMEQEKPNLIFVDLDDRTASNGTLAQSHKEIGGIPLVLDTGNGYAAIQPIDIISFTNATLNQKRIFDIPKKFLQFAERHLTNGKCDTGSNHPSLMPCMIRVPSYSYNKKSLLRGKPGQDSQVRIHSEWNGTRPNIQDLPFLAHLQKMEQEQKKRQNGNLANQDEIFYIENILQNKNRIHDGKKRIFALILCPYLANVKKLTLEECEKILTGYFDNTISKRE